MSYNGDVELVTLEHKNDSLILEEALNKLDERYSTLIRMHYGIGMSAMSQTEIASKLGLLQASVSRSLKIGRRKLKELLEVV